MEDGSVRTAWLVEDLGVRASPERAAQPSAAEVSAAVVKDVPSLGDLVRDNAGYIWHVLRSLGVREPDLDDMCQEVFLVVQRKLDSFEFRASLSSWLYGIAVRVASGYRSRAHRRREVLGPDLPEPAFNAPQEEQLEELESWQWIESLLGRLSEEQRQVFVLYELEEFAMPEVSEIVGCPLQTAYSRLRAARTIVERAMAARRAGRR